MVGELQLPEKLRARRNEVKSRVLQPLQAEQRVFWLSLQTELWRPGRSVPELCKSLAAPPRAGGIRNVRLNELFLGKGKS